MAPKFPYSLPFSEQVNNLPCLLIHAALCHENFHHNLPIGDNVDLQQWQCGEEVKPQSLQDEQVLGVGKKEATPLSHLWSLEFSGVLIYCRPLTGLRLSDSCDSVHLILVWILRSSTSPLSQVISMNKMAFFWTNFVSEILWRSSSSIFQAHLLLSKSKINPGYKVNWRRLLRLFTGYARLVRDCGVVCFGLESTSNSDRSSVIHVETKGASFRTTLDLNQVLSWIY